MPLDGASAHTLATGRAPLPSGLCVLCRSWCAQGLCEACLAMTAGVRSRCARCARPTAVAVTSCGACLRASPAYERAITLADYEGPWPSLITAFKFRRQVDLAPALADALVAAIRRERADRPDRVIPVPLSAARLRERGYNQAWELARRVARRLGCQASCTALQRVRDTAHQIGMTRDQRERNLRDAFWVDARGRASLVGQRLALVDDVMTTGATAQAAALALKRAGAASVQLWVLARTTFDDE